MIQLVVDEDLTPLLRGVANARGFNAYYRHQLNWTGRKDYELRRRMVDEDFSEAAQPPLDMVNTALLVDVSGEIVCVEIP